MNDTDKEVLSSLIDADPELSGESRRALLERLRVEPELRASWSRYHLIGDAMRSSLGTFPERSLAERVRAAVDEEPVSPAEPISLAERRPRARERFTGPWIGLAAAASIAAVAMVLVPVADAPEDAAPVAAAVASGGALVAARLPRRESAGVSPTIDQVATTRLRWSAPQPAVEARLNGYLVNHSAFAGNSVRGGMLPYVRIVGYEGRSAGVYR